MYVTANQKAVSLNLHRYTVGHGDGGADDAESHESPKRERALGCSGWGGWG